MYIQEINLRKLNMRLKSPFQTSFGSIQDKPFYLVEVTDELGNIGYGESVAFHAPWYTEETVETNFHIIKEFLIPLLLLCSLLSARQATLP